MRAKLLKSASVKIASFATINDGPCRFAILESSSDSHAYEFSSRRIRTIVAPASSAFWINSLNIGLPSGYLCYNNHHRDYGTLRAFRQFNTQVDVQVSHSTQKKERKK